VTLSGQGDWINHKFFKTDKFILAIWIALPVLNWIINFPHDRHNNYKIFRAMFWHLVDQKNLYAAYPIEHGDFFHYGPAFSLVIAPFAIFPDVIGGLLWGLFNVLILFYALNKLKLKQELKVLLMLLSTIELGNSVWANQYNPCISAMIILSFAMVEDEKDFYAPFWILLGTFTKVYGVVGLIFFLFSKNKINFILGCVVWAIAFFVLPMVLSSPSYIVQTYLDWYYDLISKNSQLIVSISSDLTIMGLVRKLSGHLELSNFWFFAFGLPLLLLPLIRVKQFGSKQFRLLVLASLLMFIVLFSTASEHPTYVICIIGCFLWLVLQEKIFTIRNIILIFFVLFLTGLAPTYVFSKEVAVFILYYALKALPCVVIWFLLLWDLYKKNFLSIPDKNYFIINSRN
jgi:hypothetical protein